MKKVVTKLASIILTVILVAILLSQINPSTITTALTRINPIYIIIGFFFYLGSYIFRALRFYILLNKQIRVKSLFTIVCVHNMMNNILPVRTGELAYIYMLKKLHTKPTSEGFATLMVARVFDLITVSLLFLVAATCVENLSPMVYNALWVIVGFLLLVVLMLVILMCSGEWLIGVIEGVATLCKAERLHWVQYLLKKMNEITGSFRRLKSRRIIGWMFFLSLPIWLLLYMLNYVLIVAMGIDIPVWCLILASTFSVFAEKVLPFQGIGSFGTVEAGWTVGLLSVGVPKELAITSGFAIHIVVLVYFLILGVFGLAIIKLRDGSS